MQELVSKELVLRGAYGFIDEFDRAAEALADRRISVRPLIEHVASLEDGPELFRQLARGELDAVKVILAPTVARDVTSRASASDKLSAIEAASELSVPSGDVDEMGADIERRDGSSP